MTDQSNNPALNVTIIVDNARGTATITAMLSADRHNRRGEVVSKAGGVVYDRSETAAIAGLDGCNLLADLQAHANKFGWPLNTATILHK